jgi:hypothetical protein
MRDSSDGSRLRRRANRPDHGRTPVRDGGDGSGMHRGANRPDQGRIIEELYQYTWKIIKIVYVILYKIA